MKRIIVALAALMISAVMTINDAEAQRRVGGGKNVGAQRDSVTNRQATPPAAAAPSAANPAAAAPRAGMSRWLGPLAGLAAGLGLAYLFGDQLGSIMMGILIVLAVVIGISLVMRAMGRRGGPQPAAAGAGAAGGTSQYRGLERTPASSGGAQTPVSAAAPPVAAAASVPANFDAEGFLKSAKQAFIGLQSANDRGDLEALREMTTDDMFAAIKSEIDSRGGAGQNVEVVTLNAELIEAVTERDTHWASVRFSGSLREQGAGVPEKFEEVWNLQKPATGGGWVLAGIQQLH